MCTCVRACVRACLPACLPTCLPARVRAYVRAYVRACVRACMCACMRSCVYACMRTCVRVSVRLFAEEALGLLVCLCVRACVNLVKLTPPSLRSPHLNLYFTPLLCLTLPVPLQPHRLQKVKEQKGAVICLSIPAHVSMCMRTCLCICAYVRTCVHVRAWVAGTGEQTLEFSSTNRCRAHFWKITGKI